MSPGRKGISERKKGNRNGMAVGKLVDLYNLYRG